MQKIKHRLNRKAVLTTAIITGLLMGLGGCATNQQAVSVENAETTQVIEQQTMTTNVFYLQRIALPPGAQVSVLLEDISKQDAPAEVIAETTIIAASAPPYQLDVSYNAAQIKPLHRYALRAEITLAGEVLFTNTEQVDAFANQGQAVTEILVSPVSAAASSQQAKLNKVHWQLSKLGSQAVTLEETQYIPTLTFQESDSKVVGFAGCNRFRGEYTVLADSINLSELLTTKKLCFEQMNLETEFLTALSETETYKVIDNTLTLYSNVGIALGQFTAQEK